MCFPHCWRPAWVLSGQLGLLVPHLLGVSQCVTGGSWDIPPSGPAQPGLTLSLSLVSLDLWPLGFLVGWGQAPLITLRVPQAAGHRHILSEVTTPQEGGGVTCTPRPGHWSTLRGMEAGVGGNGKKTLVTQASVSLLSLAQTHGSWGLKLLPGRVGGRGWM